MYSPGPVHVKAPWPALRPCAKAFVKASALPRHGHEVIDEFVVFAPG